MTRSTTRRSGDLFSIRPAVPGDADHLTRIAHAAKAHWGYPVSWLSAWESTLTITIDLIGSGLTGVADASGAPIGFYTLLDHSTHWQLEHLWVDPAYHARGVGRALFRHAVGVAGLRRAGAMRIESEPNAAGFYERMGAVRVGALPAPMPGAPSRVLPLLEIQVRAG